MMRKSGSMLRTLRNTFKSKGAMIPRRMPTILGYPKIAFIKLPYTLTFLLSGSTVTNANTSVSLRNVFDPSLSTAASQPAAFALWASVYKCYRVRACKWKVAFEIRDSASATTLAVNTYAGVTVYDLYTSTGSAVVGPPTSYGSFDALRYNKAQDVKFKAVHLTRNTGSGLAAVTNFKTRGRLFNGMQTVQGFERLSGRPRGTPYWPATDITADPTNVTLESYPNCYCGTTDGTKIPENFDRYINIWTFSEDESGGSKLNLPATYAYLNMMYYIEFFDPITYT